MPYTLFMHEMSLTTNLLAIIKEEMKKHEKTRLISVRVCYGALANVVPESLAMSFEILTSQQPELAGATIDLVPEPLVLSCGNCKHEFSPEPSSAALFTPCPACAEEIGHFVLSGKSLYIDNIEVE